MSLEGEREGGATHKQWRGEEIGSASVSHCGDSTQKLRAFAETSPEKERRRGFDSLPVSLVRFHRLLHECIYCLYATNTEIHSIYFRLTPFVCEYNISSIS